MFVSFEAHFNWIQVFNYAYSKDLTVILHEGFVCGMCKASERERFINLSLVKQKDNNIKWML